MSEGKDFSVEFDFTSPVKEWYSDASQQMDGMCAGSVFGKYGRLCVTNASKYEPCFRCNRKTAAYWILCLPCCLFSCPCYAIHRQLTCEDSSITIGAEVGLLVPDHLVTSEITSVDTLQRSEYIEHPAAVVVQPPSYEDTVHAQPVSKTGSQQLIHDQRNQDNVI